MSGIREWLDNLGFGEYAEAFEENQISLNEVPDLTHDILKELGIGAIGPRSPSTHGAEAAGSAPRRSSLRGTGR